jgi:hypothetical protein
MQKDGKVFCDVCGKECIPSRYTGGYGIAAEGAPLGKPGDKLCFPCCAKGDKLTMAATGKIVLYLDQQESKVTNWPGSLTFPCRIKAGRHNLARVRYDVWFKDQDGNPWHGVQCGDNSQLVHCKRIKS